MGGPPLSLILIGNTFLHCGLHMFRSHLHACWTLCLGDLRVLSVILLVDLVRCMPCRLGGAKTGVEEEVSPGDVMVIPAGVAHERYAALVMPTEAVMLAHAL